MLYSAIYNEIVSIHGVDIMYRPHSSLLRSLRSLAMTGYAVIVNTPPECLHEIKVFWGLILLAYCHPTTLFLFIYSQFMHFSIQGFSMNSQDFSCLYLVPFGSAKGSLYLFLIQFFHFSVLWWDLAVVCITGQLQGKMIQGHLSSRGQQAAVFHGVSQFSYIAGP